MSKRTRLANYLWKYRKLQGLTQKEAAFVVGGISPDQLSRYERGTRRPPLEKAIGLEIAYATPLRELFAGLYAKVEAEIWQRRAELARRRQARSTHT